MSTPSLALVHSLAQLEGDILILAFSTACVYPFVNVNGLQSRPQAEQAAFCQAHPDLYEYSHGAARLRIREGQLHIASLDAPGFASAVMPDFSAMRPL
jgi:hypothetical protein